jgi:hypothetical protein
MWLVWLWLMTCERVYVLVDEGNNEGVCDDVLDMEKIVTNIVSRGYVWVGDVLEC